MYSTTPILGNLHCQRTDQYRSIGKVRTRTWWIEAARRHGSSRIMTVIRVPFLKIRGPRTEQWYVINGF